MRTILLLLLCLTSISVASCSVIETPRTLRGNKVDPDVLKELVVGTSTKADASSLIGSPSARAAFDDNRWIYISETTRTRIGRTPGIMAQDVTVLTFDQGGVLRAIQRLNQDDGRDVSIASRATPSPGSEASFLGQLLGNVGRFSAGPSGSSTASPSGGVGGSGASAAQGL